MIRLYDYYRSSAAYRVRIALNLKGLEYEQVTISLIDGAQKSEEYRAINPSGFVPALEVDGHLMTQSLSIINYLNAAYPEPPFAPTDLIAAAHVRSMAQIVASDIHPVNNLRILKYLKTDLGVEEDAKNTWYAHWITEGFTGLEALAKQHGGEYLSGDVPGLADICLVPQIYNARRFDVSLDAFPVLVGYDAKASALEAFVKAHPDNNQ
uniref:maleylacetoacetate isomerase n=1 Tax=Magallana gigas TaxID=29159 RepID=K1P0S1_MAGGI